MKIKNLKYVLGFFFKQLFILFVLSCPIIVNGACETENTALQNCQQNMQQCLMCEQNQIGVSCNNINCDVIVELGCDSQQAAYNNCMDQQNTGQGQGGQQTPPTGDQCQEQSCNTGAGEKWDPDRCKCVCDPNDKCCGVQLNMPLPFIGDCIELNAESSRDGTTSVTSVTAFPILMQGLMKLLMSAIMVFSFLMIIVSGLMIVSGAFGGNGFATGKKIIKNVIISLILLGCSGLILSLINPSFFGG